MPFLVSSLMDSRRRLASRVLVDGLTESAAAREAGVSRTTVKLWVARARAEGIAQMPAPSRRPHRFRAPTEEEICAQVISLRREHPTWGSRKLVAVLWPDGEAPVCERTVDRILKREGLLQGAPRQRAQEMVRFEREHPNELWQMDFKGLGVNPPPYKILSVLDDATRFAVSFTRIEKPTAALVWKALWSIFGEYGVPKAILTDNEQCFHSPHSLGPNSLEARLWRLGVKTLHGRPAHPQTQGKVERIHRTLEETVGSGLLRDPAKVQEALLAFRHEYNWTRPHEALGMKTPGSRYVSSTTLRPATLPESVPPEGAELRKVNSSGRFMREHTLYQVGGGLAGEYVALIQEEGELWLRYAGRNFARLRDCAR